MMYYNNTRKAQVDVLIFNRVPKVGSQSLMELMYSLGSLNNFVNTRNEAKSQETILLEQSEQRKLAAKIIYAQKPPVAYSQHVAYLNFTKMNMPRPIYINLVRDPVERIISWHYYVRAKWYYEDVKLKLGPIAPPTPDKEFMEMDLDTCVKTKNIHCQYTQGDLSNIGQDHRRQTLFFCGQNIQACMPFNSEEVLQRAKRTVEEEYAVVGTWEDTNITLAVFEHYIPKFFKHAKVAYYIDQHRFASVNKNPTKGIVSNEVREMIRKNFTREIEFYEFCKQRLYRQYAAIGWKLGDEYEYSMIDEA